MTDLVAVTRLHGQSENQLPLQTTSGHACFTAAFLPSRVPCSTWNLPQSYLKLDRVSARQI